MAINKQKWFHDSGVYQLEIDGYKLMVTDNNYYIWWCCILGNEVIDSSYNKNNPQSMTIQQAKDAAYQTYLNHYTDGVVFPDFLN